MKEGARPCDILSIKDTFGRQPRLMLARECQFPLKIQQKGQFLYKLTLGNEVF